MKKAKKPKQKRIAQSIYLPLADAAFVQRVALESGHTFTAVIRMIVREFVTKAKVKRALARKGK